MQSFGAGVMVGTQTINAAGAAVALPSPVQFGILQDITLDESFELKKLYGANKFPVAVAQGKGNMSLKAKLANFNAELVNTFLYGLSLNPVYGALYQDLSGTLIGTAGSPNITPTLFGTALTDMGVISAVNGIPYTRVASAPTAGQYSFSAGSGMWTFDGVHDTGKTVFINYAYGTSSGGGGVGPGTGITGAKQLIITNQPMGVMPEFAVDLQTQFLGKTMYMHFPRVVANKLSRAYKNDDFTIMDFEMEACADDSGNVRFDYYYE